MMAVLDTISLIETNIFKKSLVMGVFLDLKKAFDTVPNGCFDRGPNACFATVTNVFFHAVSKGEKVIWIV